jgi:hypothetical protein
MLNHDISLFCPDVDGHIMDEWRYGQYYVTAYKLARRVGEAPRRWPEEPGFVVPRRQREA